MFGSYPRMRHWGILITLFVFGILIGFLPTRLLWQRDIRSLHGTQKRLTDDAYRFVKPLLYCDVYLDERQSPELEPLQKSVRRIIDTKIKAGFVSDASVYFRGLNSGRWFEVEGDKKFAGASLIKVPILMAYLKAMETSPSLLSETIRYLGDGVEFPSQLIPSSQILEAGKTYTIEELLRRMIIYSGNRSMSVLVQRLGPSIIDKVFSDIKLPLTKSQAGDALISPKDYSHFFRVLYNASYLSFDLSEKALDMLSRTEFKDGLVAGVPSGIIVAHKFGEREQLDQLNKMTGLEFHDCGIIYYPEHPYFLCVMTRGENLGSLQSLIQDISKTVYQGIDQLSTNKTTGTRT